MDPVSIGTTVIVAVVANLAGKLLKKASDPEQVARSVDWVFEAAGHFLKIQKEKKTDEVGIAPPPAAAPVSAPQPVTEAVIEEKRVVVEQIAQAAPASNATSAERPVRMVNLDDVAMRQLNREVESLLDQLTIYLENLRFEEEKAALHGGLAFAPPLVMNSIRIQHKEIARCVVRLNEAMRKVYGAAAVGLDKLVEVAGTP